ncbi:MAG TPA: type II CAAX endopeptidase family protein [Longimicrobiaceae bacterium]
MYALLFLAFTVLGNSMLALMGLEGGDDPTRLAPIATSLAASLAAGWVMMSGVERRPFGAMGFALGRAAPGESGWGTLLGAAFLGAAVLGVAATGGARWIPDAGTLPGYLAFALRTLAFFAVAAALEEVLFRGYPFQALARGIGAWPAAVLLSLLFALAHAQNPNVRPLGLANIALAGLMLSAAYLRTRSLWFATGVHLGWNWAMATLLDLPVSGLEIDTPLYTGMETGPDWWTGGAFGPEAGLAATLAITAGTVWLLRTPRLRESPDVRRLRPIIDPDPAAPVESPTATPVPEERRA